MTNFKHRPKFRIRFEIFFDKLGRNRFNSLFEAREIYSQLRALAKLNFTFLQILCQNYRNFGCLDEKVNSAFKTSQSSPP